MQTRCPQKRHVLAAGEAQYEQIPIINCYWFPGLYRLMLSDRREGIASLETTMGRVWENAIRSAGPPWKWCIVISPMVCP